MGAIMPSSNGVEYDNARGSVGWALELCEGQTVLQRARWNSGAAKLIAETLRGLTEDQRIQAVERMKRGNEIPTPSNLLAWAGSAPREKRERQAVEERQPEAPQERDARMASGVAAFIGGVLQFYADCGKPVPQHWIDRLELLNQRKGDPFTTVKDMIGGRI